MRMMGFMRGMALAAVAAMGMPAVVAMGSDHVAVVRPEPVTSNARKRARRAALVASGDKLRRRKGPAARRKLKPNRLHVSRRARRRHRRARGRA